MRILLVTQWFDPEPTAKGLLFARKLHALGHNVTVLTGFPNYPGGTIYPGYRIRPLSVTNQAGVRVIRVPLYPSHDSSPFRRLLNYGSFAVASAMASLSLSKFDIAYVYHPPGTVGLAALVLRIIRDTPFVYDIQDLWPDSLQSTGMVGHRTLLAMIGRWMSVVYRSATYIVVQSPGFANALVSRAVSPDKIRVIYNWTFDSSAAAIDTTTSSRPLGLYQGKFNVVFAGNVGPAQQLDVLVDAAAVLATTLPSVVFHVVGSGIDLKRLERLAEGRGLGNVAFHGRRDPSEMPQILSGADALLVHLREDPLFSITIPSKTQAYMLAARPILMGVSGDAADLVTRAKAGVAFKPGDPRSLSEAVSRIASLSSSEREQMGKNGKDFYLTHLASDVGVARLADVFSEAVTKHSGRKSRRRHGFPRVTRRAPGTGRAGRSAKS